MDIPADNACPVIPLPNTASCYNSVFIWDFKASPSHFGKHISFMHLYLMSYPLLLYSSMLCHIIPTLTYANLSCSPLASILIFGIRSPAFRYPQLHSTSFCATIGTTLFPIRATCLLTGYLFPL